MPKMTKQIIQIVQKYSTNSFMKTFFNCMCLTMNVLKTDGFKIVFIFTEQIVISFSSAWWSADNCVSLPMYMSDK